MTMQREDDKGRHTCYRGHERGRQCGRRDFRSRSARTNQDRSQDRPATDPVDTANASDHGGNDGQHKGSGSPVAIPVSALRNHEPRPERDQHRCDHDLKADLTGQQLNSDNGASNDPGQRPSQQISGQLAPGLTLSPVSIQRSRCRHHVVQQVCWRNCGARRAEHANLEWEEKDCPRNAAWAGHGRHDERGPQCGNVNPGAGQHPLNVSVFVFFYPCASWAEGPNELDRAGHRFVRHPRHSRCSGRRSVDRCPRMRSSEVCDRATSGTTT
jgi:hypothetical protein